MIELIYSITYPDAYVSDTYASVPGKLRCCLLIIYRQSTVYVYITDPNVCMCTTYKSIDPDVHDIISRMMIVKYNFRISFLCI